jgi:hypothetical protein
LLVYQCFSAWVPLGSFVYMVWSSKPLVPKLKTVEMVNARKMKTPVSL